MNIVKGKLVSPLKVVIYGPEGIGKTSFAMKFPNPVFADTEGSTKRYSVARFWTGIPQDWDMLLEAIEYAKAHPEEVGTFVLDTADWADNLCAKKVCEKNKVKGIEDIGYGKGYTYMGEEWQKMLTALETLTQSGINVVVTAHAKMRKFEQPDEAGAYDRWEMKLSKQAAPLVKEWADMLLFANYKTTVYEDSKTKSKKATGGKRVMFTQHHPCWDAKNRDGLPEELPFEYEAIKDIIEGSGKKAEPKKEEPKAAPVKAEEPKEEFDDSVKEARKREIEASEIPNAKLKELMLNSLITEPEIQTAVSAKGYYAINVPIKDYPTDFIEGVLVGAWEQVSKLALSYRNLDEIPFE